jgi:hypothetical protein
MEIYMMLCTEEVQRKMIDAVTAGAERRGRGGATGTYAAITANNEGSGEKRAGQDSRQIKPPCVDKILIQGKRILFDCNNNTADQLTPMEWIQKGNLALDEVVKSNQTLIEDGEELSEPEGKPMFIVATKLANGGVLLEADSQWNADWIKQ